jgi:hypothetical protein
LRQGYDLLLEFAAFRRRSLLWRKNFAVGLVLAHFLIVLILAAG